MRILHIINNLGSGGAEKLIEQLLPILNKKNQVRADVLLLTDEGNVFEKDLHDNGVRVSVVPLRKPKSPRNVFYILRHIQQGKYDIVHAHLFPALYWTAFAARLISQDRPVFFVTEHSTHNRRRGKWFLRPVERIVYESYDGVVCISEKTRDNLIQWLGAHDDQRFITIYNGVDVELFKNAIPYRKYEICPDFNEQTILISMTGRFSIQKDQRTLIYCMNRLPGHVHLLLIGDGPLRAACEDLAEKLGIDQRVHFLGFRKDVERIVKASDLVVLSSHWEGFGLAAVEGMAAGKPVIASNVPGLAEVVENAGILFKAGDSGELVKAISSLLDDEEKYRCVANACAERAAVFDNTKMVDRYLACYKDLHHVNTYRL